MPKMVRLRPTGHAFIPGEPGEDEPGSGFRDVPEWKALELLSYTPPAFYRDAPAPAKGPGDSPGLLIPSGKE